MKRAVVPAVGLDRGGEIMLEAVDGQGTKLRMWHHPSCRKGYCGSEPTPKLAS